MKHKGWKWFGKAIAAGIAACCVLSLFSALYYNPPVHVASATGATGYTREANRFWSRLTEGIAHGKTDENGFNNAYQSDQPVDALMIGSSQTEGLYLDADKCAAYLLNEKFAADGSNLYVYNIGMSAHDLYETVAHLDTALETYQPEEYVFFETSILAPDPDLMAEALSQQPEELSSVKPGTFSYVVQSNPFVKLIYQQINNYKTNKENEAFAEEETKETEEEVANGQMTQEEADEYLAAVTNGTCDEFVYGDQYWEANCQYLDYMAGLCATYDCQPVIYYIPTIHIEDDGSLTVSADEETRAVFASMCAERGILFADMTDSILNAYYEDHNVASGFANTAVGYGHLNEKGHEILCDVIYDAVTASGSTEGSDETADAAGEVSQ